MAKRAAKTGYARVNGEAEEAVARREHASFEQDMNALGPDGPGDGERLSDALEIDKPPEEAAKPTMREVFGPGGLLERCMIGGYEHRRGQLEMAEMVHDAFEAHHHAILEAGTGTGKTLAYLIPAICSGRRVVISTATKSLQEQLYQKDIPFLQKHFAPNLKVAVMKGRSNFLCVAKMNAMADQALLKGMEELDAFQQIKQWAKLTETGDRAELTFLPDDSDLWTRLDARRDTC
ncbi:MAG: DEAD/DEAH box helicase, partial [Candidatus Acidiferrum sp.]